MSLDQDGPELRHALPSDIVRCIAEHLQDSSATLASLCLVDRQSLALVLPLLYYKAHLKTVRSIKSFCDSIINSHHDLGRHAKSVHFDPPDPGDEALYPLVYPICSALQRAPYLTNLSLCIDVPNTLIYEYFQSNAPFSLIQFTCYNPPRTHPLIAFFTTQTSITHLTIYEPTLATSSYTRPSGYIRSLPAHTLPNLKFICANPLTVHALLPGRPITHIDTDRATLFNATTYLLCEGLKQSTAPGGIQFVAVCIPQTKFWTGASDFMTRLAGVCGSCLRELRLTMTDLSVGMANLRDYAPLVEVLLASLAGFDQLERFRFDDVLVEMMTPEILVEGLGEVGTLAYWKEQIKTLNGVTLFGIKLT